MLEIICNTAIFALGLSAMILIARKNKWGFIAGLASQPFWYITTYQHEQWGIFCLNFAYTATWLYGIYMWWFKEPTLEPSSKPA